MRTRTQKTSLETLDGGPAERAEGESPEVVHLGGARGLSREDDEAIPDKVGGVERARRGRNGRGFGDGICKRWVGRVVGGMGGKRVGMDPSPDPGVGGGEVEAPEGAARVVWGEIAAEDVERAQVGRERGGVAPPRQGSAVMASRMGS